MTASRLREDHRDDAAKVSDLFDQTASCGLFPIRIGVVAQQPAPDACDQVYVGAAHLLPQKLRPLCGCAGLVFVQIVSEQEEQVVVRVAALPRYFDSNEWMSTRHVRRMTTAYAQLDQLVEWDQRLAGMATCDLRELVAEHAAKSRHRTMRKEAEVIEVSVATDSFSETPVVSTTTQEDQQDEQEMDLEPLPAIHISQPTVRQVFSDLQITAKRERRVHTAILMAARRTIEAQLAGHLSSAQRRAMEQQYEQIRSVQHWRRQRCDRGHGWQRVATVTETWEEGCMGWNVVIGVPVAA